MLINFFLTLRKYKVPVTIRELMDLITALQHRVVYANVDDFYLLSRTCLVKDEKNYDKFDRAFSAYFKGLEDLHGMLEALIPDEWLRREFEKSLTPEELEQINSLGGLEKLIEAFQKAREEEEKRQAEEGRQLRAAIEELPDRYRVPIVLRYYADLDYGEVAETLGVSRGQVATLLFRARQRLRQGLAPERGAR